MVFDGSKKLVKYIAIITLLCGAGFFLLTHNHNASDHTFSMKTVCAEKTGKNLQKIECKLEDDEKNYCENDKKHKQNTHLVSQIIEDAPEKDDLTRIAIIVDDGGYNPKLAEQLMNLDIPLTWSIIPYLKNTQTFMKLADLHEIPYLVHMPMEAVSDTKPSQYIIGRNMTYGDIRTATEKAFNTMPGAIGLNNHRGSYATSQREIITPVIDEIAARHLIFVDSRTYHKSVAYNIAREKGVKTYINNGFLDGEADKNKIRHRFDDIIRKNKRKNIVLICHFRPETIKFLKELDENYNNKLYSFVTIADL